MPQRHLADVVLTSTEDNIVSPQHSVDSRSTSGRRRHPRHWPDDRVPLNHKIGHLALFVSAKVGAKEDEEFVQLMDVIDCLSLACTMVISPRPSLVPTGGFVTGDSIARFEARSLDDIRALGRNRPEGRSRLRRRGPAVGAEPSIFRIFMQPLVRALAASRRRTWSYPGPPGSAITIFADRNPWMKAVRRIAAGVAAARRPLAATIRSWR